MCYNINMNRFLPVCMDDLARRGIARCDFIIVSGDAYVDHPSFAAAVIGRWLESLGYAVGVIAQPDFEDSRSVCGLGEPKYAFLVSPGNLDGMVNIYTANKRLRSRDAYSPGGRTGLRPKRASITYTSMLKARYPNTPVIIGGIECSLRRLSHYDYWEDKVRRSILFDSKADMLVYGMGEAPLEQIARLLKAGRRVSDIRGIRGTCTVQDAPPEGAVILPSYEEVRSDKERFSEAVRLAYFENDPLTARPLAQKHGNRYLVQYPPQYPPDTRMMDRIYGLPYAREAHPAYKEGVSALDEVKFGVIMNRGCFGGCSFCSITAHQGPHISRRSDESVIREVELITRLEGFKGYIHDIGGPTANFLMNPCAKSQKEGFCKNRSCLYPQKCKNLECDNGGLARILEKAAAVPGVKKVFVRSGLRYDYIMYDRGGAFLDGFVNNNVSGQLKVAPEHVSGDVLRLMRKPGADVYAAFERRFDLAAKKAGKARYLLPYFISAHPGSGINEAIELACYLKSRGFVPDQMQDFYPTPGTIATCMYYTGADPFTGETVYSARSERERREQRAIIQFNKPGNRKLVKGILERCGRRDLIGKGPGKLVD